MTELSDVLPGGDDKNLEVEVSQESLDYVNAVADRSGASVDAVVDGILANDAGMAEGVVDPGPAPDPLPETSGPRE